MILLLLLPGLALAGVLPQGSRACERVIFLGFDGADAGLVEKHMEEGVLPNLARLRAEGTYLRLGSTNPAQSPVSWAALNAGANPGKTGLFDFVNRANADPATGKALAKPEPRYALLEPITVRTADLFPIDPGRPGLYASLLGLAGFALAFLLARLFGAGAIVRLLAGLLVGAVAAGGVFQICDWLPETLPAAKNPQRAAPFWEAAGKSGIEFAGLEVPMAFPPDPAPRIRLLCGLGVPDVRQSPGEWFVYTTDETESLDGPPEGLSSETGGYLYRVVPRGGRIETLLPGPRNFWRVEKLEKGIAGLKRRLDETKDPDRRFDLEEEIDRLVESLKRARREPVSIPLSIGLDAGAVEVTLGGRTERLRPGEWSDFFRVKFALNPLLRLSALVRAKLLEWSGVKFRLYVEPINFDPAAPPPQLSLSVPRAYSAEIAEAIGPYETAGWACATNPLKDSAIDDQTFLEDVEAILGSRERMLDFELSKKGWRILFVVFSEPDRVGHMMFRHVDAKNPLHRPEKAAARLRAFGREFRADAAIRECYREMDRIVGKALAAAGAGTVVLVASDHGFSSFRTGVNLNNWLLDNDYLAILDASAEGTVVQLNLLQDPGKALRYVDWSRTKAYSLGLGKIFLNLRGRETQGSVDPSEAESLGREIAARLEAWRDPETGAKVVRRCYRREEIYAGPHVEGSADLVLGFEEGYRVSWQSTLGGIELRRGSDGSAWVGGRVLLPNDQPWSGDHCSLDPAVVPGIFFSTAKFSPPDGGADVLHMAPTVLSLLGVAVPPEMDRPPLRLR